MPGDPAEGDWGDEVNDKDEDDADEADEDDDEDEDDGDDDDEDDDDPRTSIFPVTAAAISAARYSRQHSMDWRTSAMSASMRAVSRSRKSAMADCSAVPGRVSSMLAYFWPFTLPMVDSMTVTPSQSKNGCDLM